MNMADAIRRAAMAAGQTDSLSGSTHSADETHGTAETTTPSPGPTRELAPAAEAENYFSAYAAEGSVCQTETEEEAEMMSFRSTESVSLAEAPQSPTGPTTAVRLELFLAPEQISSLMRCIVATQHSVMTLREAAQFLRIPGATLEQLASDRAVPAFQFDGRWRFSRATLEEWLSEQGRPREEAS